METMGITVQRRVIVSRGVTKRKVWTKCALPRPNVFVSKIICYGDFRMESESNFTFKRNVKI